MIYILYHKNCADGTGAKYAAWKKFGDAAEYTPVTYGHEPPPMQEGSEVYILDFSYSREVLQALRKVMARVVVIDHHKTAEEALRGLPDCIFDMTKSGAVLAWEYFHKETISPKLLQHVMDRDLWQWKLDGTKEISCALPLLKNSMTAWDNYKDDPEPLRIKGEAINEYNALKIEADVPHHVKYTEVCLSIAADTPVYKVWIINTNNLISETGEAICLNKKHPVDFALMFTILKNNEVLCSLRSVGAFDTTVIAKAFGGGGHANASGFSCDLTTFLKIWLAH